MLEECINIFMYLQRAKRKQRAGEFPGRAQHLWQGLAVKPSLLTRQCFSSLAVFHFNTCRGSAPRHSPLTKSVCTSAKLTSLGLKAYQVIKEINKEINKQEARLVLLAAPLPKTLPVGNAISLQRSAGPSDLGLPS